MLNIKFDNKKESIIVERKETMAVKRIKLEWEEDDEVAHVSNKKEVLKESETDGGNTEKQGPKELAWYVRLLSFLVELLRHVFGNKN
jgi:hypothetical protein